jgi:hypothetical protein
MKRNIIFVFQWITWLCFTLVACSELDEELSVTDKTNESNSDTRAELIEYTIQVDTAGTLNSLVEAGCYSDAQKLIITGNIAYEDVNYVDMNMPTVEVLDLSEAMYKFDYIEGHFLSSTTKIKEISLPKNIKSIKNGVHYEHFSASGSTWGAFNNCTSLTIIHIPDSVTSIEDDAFYGCSSLTSINIPESVTNIGSGVFSGCSSLRIVKWNTTCSITDYISLSGKLILYGTEDITSTEGYNITTAKQAIYTKIFSSSYENPWYTISLPFKPTQFTHETKGIIAPFDSDIEDAKNFWLRELTSYGYRDVTEMEASHAYIIAMPTSGIYSDDSRLNGTVTFSAENVTLSWDPDISEGTTYSMYPTYETVKKSKDIYALNSEYWVNGYDYGRAWVHSAMDVEPFQAYVKLNDGTVTMRSVLPMANSKRTAVRGSNDASSRGAYGYQKPRKEDM